MKITTNLIGLVSFAGASLENVSHFYNSAVPSHFPDECEDLVRYCLGPGRKKKSVTSKKKKKISKSLNLLYKMN